MVNTVYKIIDIIIINDFIIIIIIINTDLP